jgi:LPS O-antigen subunit length determinant protein (WzzB/FepE family)
VSPNQKDNSIQVSMRFRDPGIASDIVNYTLLELTDHMSTEARRVADTNKKYLESQVDKTADPFIKAKIYALIAQQIETAMMAEVKENFAFKVLDPPKAPDKKISPKRVQMVIISFIVAIFIGLLAAFIREYWMQHKGELRS